MSDVHPKFDFPPLIEYRAVPIRGVPVSERARRRDRRRPGPRLTGTHAMAAGRRQARAVFLATGFAIFRRSSDRASASTISLVA